MVKLVDRLASLSPAGRLLVWLALSLFLRSASLAWAVLDIDESSALVLGDAALAGAVPYVDFTDHKPPGLFYAFALLSALTGGNLVAIHAIVIAYVAVTAEVLVRALRAAGADPARAAAGGAVTVLLSSLNVVSANHEVLANLPLAGALWCAAMAETRAARRAGGSGGFWLAAGLLVATATLVRPQSGIALPAFGGYLCAARARLGRPTWLLDAALLGTGFLAPVAAIVGAFAAIGELDAFMTWNVERNIAYPAPDGWVWLMLESVGLFGVGAAGWAWFLAGRPLAAVARRLWRGGGTADRPVLLGALLLAASAAAVCVGRRFYPHYFVQLALPLAWLAGPALVDRARAWASERRRAPAVALAVAIALPAIGFLAAHWIRGALGQYPEQEPRVRAVAAFLDDPRIPRGPIALWGDCSALYYLTKRAPGTRYFSAAPLVGNFDANHLPEGFDPAFFVSEPDVRAYLEDLERRRPPLVVDTSTAGVHFWDRIPMHRVGAVRRFVEANYRLLARVAGVEIHARRDVVERGASPSASRDARRPRWAGGARMQR